MNIQTFAHQKTQAGIKAGMIKAMNCGAINPPIGKAGKTNTQTVLNRKGKPYLTIEFNKSKAKPFSFRSIKGVDVTRHVEGAIPFLRDK